MKATKRKLTLICAVHYMKLCYRSLLLVVTLVMYVLGRIRHSEELFGGYEDNRWVLGTIWLVFAVEMACRFFPSRLESTGCGKQFRRNYRPTGQTEPKLQSWKRTLAVVAAWTVLNGIIGSLYLSGILDGGIMILISLAYSVCDMICILFFCPFQTWFMKNRCCSDCRIYNWDYAMMFTPLVFIPNLYAWSLLGISLLLLVRWEITLRRFPERFAVNTNACLSCAACTEKLCHHKKQLRHFREKNLSFEKSRRKSK